MGSAFSRANIPRMSLSRRSPMWKIKGFIKSTCIALLPLYTSCAFAQAQTAAQPPRYDLAYDIISPVMGRNGMVASEQALASRVGLDLLQRGGHRVRAAV